MEKTSRFYGLDYVLILAMGAVAILGAWADSTYGIGGWLRQIAGLLFVILGPGYVLTTLIFPKENDLTVGERVMYSIAASLFLVYPAGFLNVLLIEGQDDIFRPHLIGFLGILMGITFGLILLGIGRRRKEKIIVFRPWKGVRFNRFVMGLGVLALAALTLRLIHLTGASVNQDEFEIGYRAYDLVDGMQAGRRAYFLSGTDHSPLGFYLWHAFYNLLSPFGFYTLNDAMLRLPAVFMGLLAWGGGGILAHDLFKNKKITLTFLALLAVDQYAVFASRLGIPQDLATLTFFMIVSVRAAFRYWEKPTPSNALWAGTCFGVVLLVKFSAVLLVPLFLAGWLIMRHQRKVADGIRFLGASLALFSPVMIYNLGTYLAENYLDVSFAKIARLFDAEVNSLMPASDTIYGGGIAPFQSLYEFQFLLMDQWNLLVYASVAVAIGAALISLGRKESHRFALIMLLLWIASALLFFSLNGFRAYYAAFLSVPALLLLAAQLQKWQKNALLKHCLLGLVLLYSTLYTFQTHVRIGNHLNEGEKGRLGYGIIVSEPLARPYSLSTLGMLNDKGLTELREALNTQAKEGDTLVFDPRINDLLIRWYFHSGDEVRRFYLGDAYEDHYRLLAYERWQQGELGWPKNKIYIILLPDAPTDNLPKALAPLEIRNRNNRLQFLIYQITS